MRTERGARELCRGVGGIELARLKSGLARCSPLSVSRHLREKTQDLQIEPNQRHHQ